MEPTFSATLLSNLRRAHDLFVEVRGAAPHRRLDELLAGHPARRVLIRLGLERPLPAALAGLEETLAGERAVSLFIELGPGAPATVERSLGELLPRLEGLGFEVHLLRDSDRQAVKVRGSAPWTALLAGQRHATLYCQQRPRALAVAMVFHSSLLGGAERSLLTLAERLVRDHAALVLALLPGSGPLAARLADCGAVVRMAGFDWWCDEQRVPQAEQRIRLRRSLRGVLAALPSLSSFGPDVVVGNTLVQPWSAVLASLLGVPHVCRVSELGEGDHDLHFFLPLDEVEREFEAGSALLLASSDLIRQRRFPRSPKCRVVYPPVDVPAALSKPPRPAGAPPARFRIGTFSALAAPKGQEDAVGALAELVRRGHDAELLLAGYQSRSYGSYLRQLALGLGVAGRVRLSGLLEDPYTEMVDCDAVVVCSRLEAFGRVAVEAMLLGVPLVCTGRGGLAEITREGETALWYPAGDARGLADRLEELIRDPAGTQRRATAARRDAARFRGEVAADLYAAALRELRGAPGAPLPRFLAATLGAAGAGPED